MTLSLIAAMDRNALIGSGGKLLWHLPADLKHFRDTTGNSPVIMGRKTYDSLPTKLLPGRHNIILTRSPSVDARRFPGWEMVHGIDEAIHAAERECRKDHLIEAFVIGGATVYMVALPQVDRIYLTLIEHEFPPGNSPVYFPGGIPGLPVWEPASSRVGRVTESNPWPHTFWILNRVTETAGAADP